MPQVPCKMWNVKCSACSKYNVTMETIAAFASNLTTNVCLILVIYILSDLFSNRLNYYSRWLWTDFL